MTTWRAFGPRLDVDAVVADLDIASPQPSEVLGVDAATSTEPTRPHSRAVSPGRCARLTRRMTASWTDV